MLSIAEKKLQKDQAYHSLSLFSNDFYPGLCEVGQAGFYYDVITSGFCLDHIECDIEYIRVLNKIRDSLKDDGFYFHIEKSADKKNIASSSWLMYEKLVLLRKNKMIDLGIKSEKEANEFEHHVLNDDFLRSKKDQILLIKESNLKIHDIFGLEVGYENELNDNYFNGHFQVRKINLEDTYNDSKAFIPLVIVCKK